MQNEAGYRENEMKIKPMSHTEIKDAAQTALMHAMMGAFYAMADAELDQTIVDEAHHQVHRVEKLFGFTVGTWKS